MTSRRLLVLAALSMLAPGAIAACSTRTSTGSPTSGDPFTSAVPADTDALVTDVPTSIGTTPTTIGTTSTTIGTTPTTIGTTPTTIVATPTTAARLPVPAKPPAPHANEPIVQLGTIEIPKIGVSASMFEGVSLTVLDHGPGHWPGTAQPGETGNVVVGGHRTSHSKPFRNLDQLVEGDQVIFVNSDGRFVYTVIGTEVVSPTAMRVIDQTPERTATLFACHPPGSTRQRIVVHLVLAA